MRHALELITPECRIAARKSLIEERTHQSIFHSSFIFEERPREAALLTPLYSVLHHQAEAIF